MAKGYKKKLTTPPDFSRYYSHEEIRDFAHYVANNCFNIPTLSKQSDKTLILEQLGVFENLLLEAFSFITGRNEGIKMIVCSDLIWQVVRQLLNIPKNKKSIFSEQQDVPEVYRAIDKKANYIFELHSVIRHPTAEKIRENGWIFQRQWTDEQSSFVRNIAQIIYTLIETLRVYIRGYHYEKEKNND